MPEALSLRPSSYCRALILQLLLVQLLLPFHRWPRHGFFVAEASVVVKSPWYGETGNRVRTVVTDRAVSDIILQSELEDLAYYAWGPVDACRMLEQCIVPKLAP